MEKAWMNKLFTSAVIASLVAGCGGTNTTPTATYTVLSEWSDGVGVGKGNDSEGNKAYFISPGIVDLVASANEGEPPNSDIDIESYPVMASDNGYDYRQGFYAGANIIIAVPQSGEGGVITYIYSSSYDAIMVAVGKLNGVPTGTFTYNGVYGVGLRYSDWRETGQVALEANFSQKTFTINGQSLSTDLTGSGLINNSTGQISGSGFQLNVSGAGNYSSSVLGGFGGDSASGVAGVFYTNDSSHDFVGAFAGQR